MKKYTRQDPIRRKLAAAAVAACFAAPGALANPTGPTVVHGTAAIHQAGNLLQITNSPNAIINWQSFSIGANEVTRFLQQSASSAVLNRVITQNPSQILGTLQSNGRVFLINPNGILFGAGAQVDVAGLVASTLNLSDSDFLGGRLRFTEGLGKSVVNDGSIATGAGGSVYLIGSGVANNGIIRSPQGEVILAAGNSVELVSPGTPNLRVEITATDNEARNLGQIISEAGRVGIYAGLVNNSGTIRADSAVAEGGRILLKATKSLTLEAGSVTSASGPSGGRISIQSGDTTLASGTVEATGSEGNGGRIELLGERVGLINAAAVDASGKTGGGTILVGGDYQGKNPDIQNATRNYVGREVEIRADATHEGDGGKVILWADGDTRYYGSISARGGAAVGNGGFVEVSGKTTLDFHGRVDVAAPHGVGGKVLLDPQDIVLNNTVQAAPPNNAIGTPDVAFADPPAAGTTTIQTADVTGYSELFLQATNNITVSSALAMAANGTVRFEANNNISINAALTTSGTPSTARPSITLTADADASGAGTLTVGANLTAQQGGISLSGAAITGAGNLNSTGAAGNNGGNISVTATGAVNLTGTMTASGGANAGGAGFNAGTITVSGTAVATGALTAAGSAGAANSKGGSGGNVTVTASNGNIGVGAISTVAGNTLGTGATGATVPKGGNVNLTTTGGTGNITATTISTSGATGAFNANAGGNGGNVTLDASAAGTTTGNVVVTTVNAFAGLGATGSGTGPGEGRAGGAVRLTSKGTLSFGAISTRGTAAVVAGQNGGAGGLVTIDSTTGGAITYSGAAALGINTQGANGMGAGLGGLGGAITLTDTLTINNNFVAVANAGTTVLPAGGADIQFGDVLSVAGNARTFTATTNSAGNVNVGNIGGAGTANSTGTVILTGRSITAGSINTAGRNNAAGAIVTLTGQTTGTTTVNGTITTVGGTNTAAGVGRAGGNINLSGGTIAVTGAIDTSGSAAFAGSNNNGGNAGTVTLNATGATPTVTLGAAITANGGAAATAGAAQTGGNGGTIQIQDPSLLSADVVVNSLPGAGAGGGANGTGGAVTFTGAVNSSGAGRNLTVNTPNTTTFTAAIGNTLALASLTTDAGAGATSIAGNVTTTGSQTFNDAVTLAGGGTRTFASTGGGAIAFNSTLNGGSNLVVNTAGAATFGGNVGATTALTSVTTNAGGTTSIGGNVTTTAAQTFNDAVTLTGGGTRTFASTANSAIAFNSTLDGGSGLVVNTTGITTFGGNVGATTALTSVTTNAGAGVTRIGGNVTTTAGQTFNDAVALTGNAILTGSTPTFASTVTGGGFDLTVNFSGTTTVNGATLTGIRNLATGNGGTTNLTGLITTTGTQTYNDAVTLTGATTLASGNTAIAFNSTLDGGQTLAVNTTGATTFGGNVGATTALTSVTTNAGGTTAINGGTVTTTGAQSYNDATTLGGATTLRTTAAGSISAAGALTATAGTLTLDTGAGSATFNNTANDFSTVVVTSCGAVSLVDANAVTLGPANMGSLTARALTGNLTLGGNVTASGGGDAIVLVAGANFDNSGSFNLDPGAGRWLVYSTNPASDSGGGLAYNFKHYGLTFTGPYGGPGTGNGFIYSVAPTITASLVGSTSKGYDGTATAALGPGNYATSGAIDGDTVTLNNPATGTYDNRNVGTGKNVTATVAIAGATNGAASVYGYTLSGATASGNIGEITAAPLTVTAQTDSRGYNGTTSSAVGPVVTGTLYDPVGTAVTQSFDTRHVATSKTLTAGGLVVNDGNSGNNYAVTYVADTTGVITAAPLTVTAQTDTRGYNGTANSAVAPVVTGTLYDAVGTAATQNFDTKHVGAGKTLTAGGLVVNDGNSGNNYAITYVADTTGVVTAAPLTVTAQTDNRMYNGTTSSSVAPVVTGTLYDAVGTAATQSFDTRNVGTGKTLNATGLAVNDGNSGNNYAITYVADTTGVITTAPLSITADNASRPANQPNPPFSATYSGFQTGDTPAALTGTLSFTTPATVSSPGGTYAITPFGQSSTNYSVSYLDGTLTVSGAPLSSTTFVNPLIPAVNYWVPDPQVAAPSAPVALAMDESLTPLPPTAAGPVGGSQPAVTASGTPVALAMDESLTPLQSGTQPSRSSLDDWQCLRYGPNTSLKCR